MIGIRCVVLPHTSGQTKKIQGGFFLPRLVVGMAVLCVQLSVFAVHVCQS